MSGGIAYVYDAEHTLANRCNQEMVDLVQPDRDELEFVRTLIEEHAQRTGSPLGVRMLYQFSDISHDFVKVVPREFAQVMTLTQQFEEQGRTHDEAVELAFEMRETRS